MPRLRSEVLVEINSTIWSLVASTSVAGNSLRDVTNATFTNVTSNITASRSRRIVDPETTDLFASSRSHSPAPATEHEPGFDSDCENELADLPNEYDDTCSHYSRTSSPLLGTQVVNMITTTTTSTTPAVPITTGRIGAPTLPAANASVASHSGMGLLGDTSVFREFVTFNENRDRFHPQVYGALGDRIFHQNSLGTSVLRQHQYGTSAYQDALRQLNLQNDVPTALGATADRPPLAPRHTSNLLDHSAPSSARPGPPRMASSAAASTEGLRNENTPPRAFATGSSSSPDNSPGHPRYVPASQVNASTSIPLDALAQVV